MAVQEAETESSGTEEISRHITRPTADISTFEIQHSELEIPDETLGMRVVS
jgi:hypothetical protein